MGYAHMSSRGEMNTSLRLMICTRRVSYLHTLGNKSVSYILVLDVFQKLQLPVRALCEYWGAEGLHDLLDRDGRARKLIPGRTG